MNDSLKPLKLIAVAAMSCNRVIGKAGKLPWHIPEDLQFFKRLTSGSPVLMGRKTFESIGRPLPDRRNFIVSTSLDSAPEGTMVINSIDELNDLEPRLSGKVFVIGGAQIYASLMGEISEIYLSYIYDKHEGDTYFPEFEKHFAPYEIILKNDLFEVRHFTRCA